MSIVTADPLASTDFLGIDTQGAVLDSYSSTYSKYGVCQTPLQVINRSENPFASETSATTASSLSSIYMVDTYNANAYTETARTVVEVDETDAGYMESTMTFNIVESIDSTDTEGNSTTDVTLQSVATLKNTGMYVRGGVGDKTTTNSVISMEYDGIVQSNTDASIYFGGSENFRIKFATDTPTTGKNSLLFQAYDGTSDWVTQFSMEKPSA